MNIHTKPTPLEKLAQLGDVTAFEPAGDSPQVEKRPTTDPTLDSCITYVSTPTGKKPLLKTMVTTVCEKNCFYCPFRAGRGQMRREHFTPDELAHVFDQMQRTKRVDGLFLSSGVVHGGVSTQDKVIDTVEVVRRKYGYRGYVHLKIMPGAEMDQIRRALQVADRVSINLEAPTSERLSALAPKKDFPEELLHRLVWAGELRRTLRESSAGQKVASLVTQFVVGAVDETDLELLSISEQLYRQTGLARVYYSAFNPVPDTPFENRPAASPLREFRLYQSSFLLRDYGWDVEDLPFEQNGNLRLDVDPKRAWADLHLRYAPVEIMTADKQQLMRVPGIGAVGAEAILKARRSGRLADLAHLKAIGVRNAQHAAPYILLNGRRPAYQSRLF